MMVIRFLMDNETYSIDCRDIIEIVPRVTIRKLPHTPEMVAGMMNYRNKLVPVIDMSSVLKERPSVEHLSSRIIVVHYPDYNNENRQTLGLLAEQVTELADVADSERRQTGVSTASAPYLGDVYADRNAISQCIRISQLLPDSLKNILFKDKENVSPLESTENEMDSPKR